MSKIKLTDAPVEYKIYNLLSSAEKYTAGEKGKLPIDIDFKTALKSNLYKEVVMEKGAPVYKKYYTEAVMDEQGKITYINPVLKIDYEFERDSISLAKSCTQTFRWYDTNDRLSTGGKVIKDFFNFAESMQEAGQRRSNIIDDLKVKAIGLLMYTEHINQADAADIGKAFLAAYKAEIYNYIDEANTAFAAAVAIAPVETYPWLDNITPYHVTIRQFILNGLA